MKRISATLLLFAPISLFAQEIKNSFGISGGFELRDTKTAAWNIQTNLNKSFQKQERWSSEYGLNFYVLEHRRHKDAPILYDSTPVFSTYGTIVYPGYLEYNDVHYSRTIGIRLQAGVNYSIVKKNNFIFSAGLNVVNDLLLDYKENGQKYLIPAAGYGDTLPFYEYHYSIHRKTVSANNVLSLQIQPHIDCFIPLTSQLSLTTRLGYYFQLVRELQFVRPQMDAGIAYRW